MYSWEVSHQRHSSTKLPEEGSREPYSFLGGAGYCALQWPQAPWEPEPGAVARVAGTQHWGSCVLLEPEEF